MEMSRALGVLGEYTSQQWGLVTAAQAVGAGVNTVTLTRLADAGYLQPVRRGVYALEAAPVSPLREQQAVWLALNPATPAWERPALDPYGGVVSHVSATHVHGVGDLAANAVELTVPRRRTSRDPAVRLRVRELTDSDVVRVDGLPVTSLARTVVDLLDSHIDGSHVAQVIQDGVRTGRLDSGGLRQRIGPYARRYGLRTRDGGKLLDHLLEQGRAPVPMENSALRQSCRAAAGPEQQGEGRRQVDRHPGCGPGQPVLPGAADGTRLRA